MPQHLKTNVPAVSFDEETTKNHNIVFIGLYSKSRRYADRITIYNIDLIGVPLIS